MSQRCREEVDVDTFSKGAAAEALAERARQAESKERKSADELRSMSRQLRSFQDSLRSALSEAEGWTGGAQLTGVDGTPPQEAVTKAFEFMKRLIADHKSLRNREKSLSEQLTSANCADDELKCAKEQIKELDDQLLRYKREAATAAATGDHLSRKVRELEAEVTRAQSEATGHQAQQEEASRAEARLLQKVRDMEEDIRLLQRRSMRYEKENMRLQAAVAGHAAANTGLPTFDSTAQAEHMDPWSSPLPKKSLSRAPSACREESPSPEAASEPTTTDLALGSTNSSLKKLLGMIEKSPVNRALTLESEAFADSPARPPSVGPSASGVSANRRSCRPPVAIPAASLVGNRASLRRQFR